MKKLIITPKKYSGKSSVVSTRLPDDMVQELDNISTQTGKSRNELLVMMIEFALENVEIENGDKK